jgi:hypothetical protein
MDLGRMLHHVNQWWWQAPHTDCSLTWWDRDKWPDPWDLLQRPRFCHLAKALGMLYTLAMTDRTDIVEAELVEQGGVDIVRVHHGLYVLNWCGDEIMNIPMLPVDHDRRISIQQIRSEIN